MATREPLIIPLSQITGPAGVAILSRGIDKYVRAGGTLKDLANKAKLGKTTVSKIYYRETYFPRLLTSMLLLQAFGYVTIRVE